MILTNSLNQLTWHNGQIPEDQIWVKIGGDKGGTSFKLMVQLANVERPNSLLNTHSICVFEAKDSSFNLSVALKGMEKQIHELSSESWR